MIRQNLHTHSTWDDGQNTMGEMVQAALAAGFTSLGFSVHSYLPFAAEWTLLPEKLPEYTRAVQALRQAHAHELAVYHGIEWDMMSESNLAEFDYVIGSIHQIESQGEVFCVDASPATTADYLQRAFGGDADAAAEAYFRQYAALAKVDEVDIVGHFDLLTKFDEQNGFFHAGSPRFQAAAKEAMEALVSAGKIFEINTGAISRGYRTKPYPSRALLTELKRMGGRITISADAHSVDAIAYGFAAAEMLALDCGFREIRVFDGQAFVPESIGKVNEYD